MKISTKFYLKASLLLSIVFYTFLFTSCDEDNISTIGDDFINSLTLPEPYVVENLVSYSEEVFSVQSNTLTTYQLGEFSDNVFGTSNTSILTQLELQTTSPDFGDTPILDSVVLTLPLFAQITGFDEDRNKDTYRLDSIFRKGSFKLQVYESTQFLRDIDPGAEGEFDEAQLYYSDQFQEFQGNILFGNPLTTIRNGENDDQHPKSKVITPSDSTFTHIITDYTSAENVEDEDGNINFEIDTLRLSPRISIKLYNQFFQERILDADPNIFVSQNSFKNYLRGLLLRITEPLDGGAMINLNLNSPDANIRLYYRSFRQPPSTEFPNPNPPEETYNTYDLRLAGNTINLYDNNSSIDLSNQDLVNGEELLYAKGGEGIVTIVEPFSITEPDDDENGNGISDELEELRNRNLLINEANLIFYVDETSAEELDFTPQRIFVYDFDRNSVLLDYIIDPISTASPFTSKINHLGPLQEEDERSFYKIRLTGHINDIINNDSITTKLGVVVTENVNNIRFLNVRDSNFGEIDAYTESTISTPRGIVFYGNASSDEEKRLKLQIFYTEPNL